MGVVAWVRGFQGYRLMLIGIVAQVVLVWVWPLLPQMRQSPPQPPTVQMAPNANQASNQAVPSQGTSNAESSTKPLWRADVANNEEAILRNYLAAVSQNECGKASSYLLNNKSSPLRSLCAKQLLQITEIKSVAVQNGDDTFRQLMVNGEFVVNDKAVDQLNFNLSKRENNDWWWIADESLNNVTAVALSPTNTTAATHTPTPQPTMTPLPTNTPSVEEILGPPRTNNGSGTLKALVYAYLSARHHGDCQQAGSYLTFYGGKKRSYIDSETVNKWLEKCTQQSFTILALGDFTVTQTDEQVMDQYPIVKVIIRGDFEIDGSNYKSLTFHVVQEKHSLIGRECIPGRACA